MTLKDSGKTNITIMLSTRDHLKNIGKKGQSYDEIITWLLEEREMRDIIKDMGNQESTCTRVVFPEPIKTSSGDSMEIRLSQMFDGSNVKGVKVFKNGEQVIDDPDGELVEKEITP